MARKIKILLQKNKELLKYAVFGVATTAVNFAVYSALVLFCAGIGVTLANLISWICAVVFAFFTNKLFVFESKSFKIKTLLPEAAGFLGARVASGVIEVFLPEFLMGLGLDAVFFGIEGLLAKALVSILVIILNYVFSKLVIFKKKTD